MTLAPHSGIPLKQPFLRCSRRSFQLLSGSLSTPFDVTQPRTKCFPPCWRVCSLSGNAIPLWSKYPRHLLFYFIPSENDISQNVISPVLHGSSLAKKGGIILLVKWGFSAVRTCRRRLERLYKCVSCCQLLWFLLPHERGRENVNRGGPMCRFCANQVEFIPGAALNLNEPHALFQVKPWCSFQKDSWSPRKRPRLSARVRSSG